MFQTRGLLRLMQQIEAFCHSVFGRKKERREKQNKNDLLCTAAGLLDCIVLYFIEVYQSKIVLIVQIVHCFPSTSHLCSSFFWCIKFL